MYGILIDAFRMMVMDQFGAEMVATLFVEMKMSDDINTHER